MATARARRAELGSRLCSSSITRNGSHSFSSRSTAACKADDRNPRSPSRGEPTDAGDNGIGLCHLVPRYFPVGVVTCVNLILRKDCTGQQRARALVNIDTNGKSRPLPTLRTRYSCSLCACICAVRLNVVLHDIPLSSFSRLSHKMTHDAVWFSRPRKYGKGSRQW